MTRLSTEGGRRFATGRTGTPRSMAEREHDPTAEPDAPRDTIGEGVESLEREVTRGDTAKTPFVVLLGSIVFWGGLFAVAFLIVFLVWWLA